MELLASVDIILIKLQGPIPEDIVSKMAVTVSYNSIDVHHL